jgi:DnaJ-class molecular chaperone
MPYHHDPSTEPPRSWFGQLLTYLGERLFAADDETARARGWQIRRTRMGRVYRDPRWDTVHACRFCAGTGAHLADSRIEADPCTHCGGIGVIRSAPVENTRQTAGRTGGRS